MNTPLVSICIPTYNRPALLERAVRSCLAQSYPHFEIIITDNSDNFETRDMVLGLKDARIRYCKNETNLGALGNNAHVVSLARGKYIKLLMDDDLLMPQALELMVKVFEEHPTVGIVMAPMALIDADDRRIYPYFYVFRKMHYRYRFQVGDGLVDRRSALKHFLVRDYPCCVPSGVLYRAECFQKLGGFDLKCDFAIDLEMAMRIALHYDFYYIDQVLSAWRHLPVNHTSTLHAKGFDVGAFYYITRKILADPAARRMFPENERPRLIRDSIFFCSCRALLNGLAGIRARSGKIIVETVRLIFREDPYWWNKLRLFWFVLREICLSFIPPAKPLPKE